MSKTYKVLIVDDMRDVRKTLAGVLADRHYLVEAVDSESEAVDAVTRDYFDFIVVDVRLKGNDEEDESGMELTGKIREMDINSQVIFITGQSVKGRHFKAVKKYNALAYIEKGMDWVDEVCAAIQEYVAARGEEEAISPRIFDVFLCHNHHDKAEVKKIGEELKRHGLQPWLDEWEIQPGLPWQDFVEEQIERIRAAAVFVGESGIGPWQKMEVRTLLNEFVERGCPVIPVLLVSSLKDIPTLPLFLRQMNWVDFRKSDPDPMRQLIWGITGKKY